MRLRLVVVHVVHTFGNFFSCRDKKNTNSEIATCRVKICSSQKNERQQKTKLKIGQSHKYSIYLSQNILQKVHTAQY